MTLAALSQRARKDMLDIFGLCHTTPSDGVGVGTLAMLGPHEPGFWSHVKNQPEFKDGKADPVDRWSARVITAMAGEFSGTAAFPFGTPARPFISWAVRTQRAWSSPVHLLVHDTAGLMVSFRGAIVLPELLTLPDARPRPCEVCVEKPCLSACPAIALTSLEYDLPECHAFLDSHQGAFCMSRGCAVRRACPVSKTYGRVDAQSAFHMEQFHK